MRHFWSQIKVLLFLHEIFQLDKFKGIDFKYNNIIFQIPSENYPDQALLVPNLCIFIFTRNFTIRQIRGR